MQHAKKRQIMGLVIALAIIAISFSPQMQSYFLLPLKQKVSVGDPVKLDLSFPSSILERFVVQLHSKDKLTDKNSFRLGKKNWPVALAPGTINMYLKLFGIIPVKEMVVDVLPPIKVTPSGHSIGVVVKSKGVMVVGYSAVLDKFNNEHFPARDVGVSIGDIIVKANSEDINSDDQLADIVASSAQKNKKVKLTLNRDGKKIEVNVKPEYCYDTESYRIGLYVRDTAAGIGTMTFYDPVTKKYAALGHVIANAEIQKQISHGVGRILESTVQGIQQGKRGNPGEKIGVFMENTSFTGIINKNSRFGIYGTLKKLPEKCYTKSPIPIAYASQIKEGPAEILTVINGDQIEKFSIVIEKVIPHQKINGKGLILKITDERLLEATGGIIQGMSGSPIIQDGKLVGAVTHVFVNDPTRGYGVLAEWMLEELDIPPEKDNLIGFKKDNFDSVA
ncbi:MAG: stage sporulation protein [Clostridia bacterium]|nr:stage sporulation protein [Clostridia bacterium]